jgi:hypothetical protein
MWRMAWMKRSVGVKWFEMNSFCWSKVPDEASGIGSIPCGRSCLYVGRDAALVVLIVAIESASRTRLLCG